MNNTEINKRVAEVEGYTVHHCLNPDDGSAVVDAPIGLSYFNPVGDWSQGGPLIEKYNISMIKSSVYDCWDAEIAPWHTAQGYKKPLVAAMLAIIEAHKDQ